MPNFDYENKYWQNNLIVAGVDEVGRGCIAGPLVVSAVILNTELDFLDKLDDSKKISEKNREELFEKLLSSDIKYSLAERSPEEIDDSNILKSTMEAMHEAVEKLAIKPDILLIDGNYFIPNGIPYELIVKGDSKSYSIAAASIIAKVSRDRQMKDLALVYPNYGFENHKGYGTKKHYEAIDNFGILDIHRKSFLKKYFEKNYELFPNNE